MPTLKTKEEETLTHWKTKSDKTLCWLQDCKENAMRL